MHMHACVAKPQCGTPRWHAVPGSAAWREYIRLGHVGMPVAGMLKPVMTRMHYVTPAPEAPLRRRRAAGRWSWAGSPGIPGAPAAAPIRPPLNVNTCIRHCFDYAFQLGQGAVWAPLPGTISA